MTKNEVETETGTKYRLVQCPCGDPVCNKYWIERRPIKDRVKKQTTEFDALEALCSAYHSLPAVVDDDYPEARHRYEEALVVFLRACWDNNRITL